MGGEQRRRGGLTARTGRLIEWLSAQNLLRGPFVYADYWATVLGLNGVTREAISRDGLHHPPLFRLGVDRPDLELPSRRAYFLLFFLGPLLLPFRSFRRLGHYRIRLRHREGDEVLRALEQFRLAVQPIAPGRVRVAHGERVLADELIDPHLVIGFSSFFWATYKLPLASLVAILSVGILAPLLAQLGLLAATLDLWIPLGYPVLVLLIYAALREWAPAFIGALPVVFGRYMFSVLQPAATREWAPFIWALVALFVLYIVADWLFSPRPVPPVLMLYTRDGPAHPYARKEDAPWWLEGNAYWVWRHLVLSPAELNKFWERDWERVELWIRADGERAGALEWIVTDMHYRELWMPYEAVVSDADRARDVEAAAGCVASCRPGFWLAEIDADMIVHYPFVRTVAFMPDDADHPVRNVKRLLGALFRRAEEPGIQPYLREIDRIRIATGRHVLSDLPEVITGRASDHLLRQPWRYWRYPLGAARRRESLLYEEPSTGEMPAAADASLQIKAGVPPK